MSASEILIEDLVLDLMHRAKTARVLLGIAGPPGVGKSTFCDVLCQRLNKHHEGIAAVFPMDGFHFDDTYLDQKGWWARKGAPHTFDAGGFCHTLGRLKNNKEEFVAVPVFDRDLEIARAGARLISRDVKIILVEGNYLFLDEAPWKGVKQYFDLSVMLKADPVEIEQRLRARWVEHDLSEGEIVVKLENNDLPNVRHVLSASAPTDYEIWTDRD